ncbi:MAG: ABC transporter ATP-binding protein [Planctomycetota bacterium]|nr:ABC transporter ATP-binding protein [Planctomycetota bacterium]
MLARHRLAICGGVLMVAGFSLIRIWMARVIGNTIDGLGTPTQDAINLLAINTGMLCGLVVAEASCRYFGRRWIIDASRHIEARLKNQLMEHMSRLPVAWYDRAQTGDLLSRLTQDVELLRFLIGPSILYGTQILVTIPVGIYVMGQISSTVTFAILGAFGALLLAMLVLMPRLQKYSKRVQEDIADISQHAQESFSGIRVLLNFASSRVFCGRIDALNNRYVADNMAMTRFRASVHLVIHFCTDLVMLSVLVFGLTEVIEGRMSRGNLIEFITIMGYLVWPLIAAGWILGVIHRARAAAERVDEVFDELPEPDGGEQVELVGAIEVRNLTFTYPGESRPALSGIDFQLAAGQKLGLVGEVGCGKSTLLHLLLRLYDPPRGTIFVDGHDILDLDLRCLRRLFAFAPQDPFLFSDTVADNIRFGNATSGQSETDSIAEAVRSAALEQDLAAFTDGLETVIGERGVTLSGGQKQRVSLARALAAERPAVILDDTLSAVDHQTESRILERLHGTEQDKTILVASHRLSALAGADLILVLKNGEVIEQGHHRDLCRGSGPFAQAWALQLEARALGGEGGSLDG